MADDVRRLREIRNSAVYLIGHGPYREPRLLDVQYMRILRYADALASKLGTTFQGRRAYMDPNFPRERYLEDLPALVSLCEAIKAKQYEVVFLDLRARSISTRSTSTGACGISSRRRAPSSITRTTTTSTRSPTMREEVERVVTYRCTLDGLDIYADPRQTKALRFFAYEPTPDEPPKKRRGKQPTPTGPVDFHLLDSAKNNLPSQFRRALRAEIDKRAHYNKAYRKEPWGTS